MATRDELFAEERSLREQVQTANWTVTGAVTGREPQEQISQKRQVLARIESDLLRVEDALAAQGVPLPDGP